MSVQITGAKIVLEMLSSHQSGPFYYDGSIYVFANTEEYINDGANKFAVWKSTDEGATWAQVSGSEVTMWVPDATDFLAGQVINNACFSLWLDNQWPTNPWVHALYWAGDPEAPVLHASRWNMSTDSWDQDGESAFTLGIGIPGSGAVPTQFFLAMPRDGDYLEALFWNRSVHNEEGESFTEVSEIARVRIESDYTFGTAGVVTPQDTTSGTVQNNVIAVGALTDDNVVGVMHVTPNVVKAHLISNSGTSSNGSFSDVAVGGVFRGKMDSTAWEDGDSEAVMLTEDGSGDGQIAAFYGGLSAVSCISQAELANTTALLGIGTNRTTVYALWFDSMTLKGKKQETKFSAGCNFGAEEEFGTSTTTVSRGWCARGLESGEVGVLYSANDLDGVSGDVWFMKFGGAAPPPVCCCAYNATYQFM